MLGSLQLAIRARSWLKSRKRVYWEYLSKIVNNV